MKKLSASNFSSLINGTGRLLVCAAAAGMLLLSGVVRASETAGEFTPPQAANPQKVVVKGRVLDSTGEPLVGATVFVKGTSTGVNTDVDGNYSISVAANQTLEFSYIGMTSKEELVGTRTVIDVTLDSDGVQLEEVVAIGYGSARKVDVTGSVASIGSDAIAKTVPTSIDQVLQGRAAGVQMTQNSGLPGGGSSIRIRGVNSINSSNEPIVVIDGVIIDAQTGTNTDNALSSINPSDIESLDVLKDASATAIYGAQGANGVIIITTKRGAKGDAKVTFDANWGIQTMAKYLDMMNLREFAQHTNENYTMRGQELRDEFADPSKLSEGTDWQRALFANAFMQNYNLSVSGGSDKISYLVNGGFLDQDGIAAGSSFQRYTVRGVVDAQAKKWLKIGINTSMSYSKQVITVSDNDLIMTALQQSPAVEATTPDGGFGGPDDDNFTQSNPLGLAKLIDNYNKKAGVRNNVYLEFTPIEGLSYRTEFSTDINVTNAYRLVPTYQFGAIINSERSNTQSKQFNTYWAWRNVINYNKTFAEKHALNVMLATEMSSARWEYLEGKRLDGSNSLGDLNAGDSTTATNSGYSGENKFASVFGRLFYAYDERYLVTATLRYDGNSRFADGHRWGLFPAVALAWRISNEPFLRDSETLTNLKLRMGYGQVGNSNVTQFAYAAMLNPTPTNWGVGQLTSRVPNENLEWETTDSYNIGVDLGLFDNRIELIADAYYKKTKNLLLEMSLPSYLGSQGQGAASAPWANMGSIENKGFEFTLNTVNIQKRDFMWRSSVVFSLNRNKILSLNSKTATIDRTLDLSGGKDIVTRTQVGRSIGEFYGYKIKGRINSANDLYDKDGNLKVALPKNVSVDEAAGVWVGDFLWEDITPDGVIDENDRTFLGSALPKFTMGFGNTFTYKGWDLSLYFTGSYGNKALNWVRRYTDDPRGTTNHTRRTADYARLALLDESRPADDIWNVYVKSGHSSMPRMSASDVNNNNRLSDRFVEDASYIRLQNLSLSYSFPKKWISKIHIENLRLYMNITNVFTLTKYSGYDPEIGAMTGQYDNSGQDALTNGIDRGRYPSPRTYTFGLSVGF